MRLGMVEIDRLEQRRDNPRAMSQPEFETLKRSMDRFGFKSFVVVEEIAPGRYGVIDGHHRWRAATERKMDRVPVVLLDNGTEKSWADLAMLTFNVTGDPQEDKFIDLVSELTKTLGHEVTAAFTALDPGFLENFGQQMEEAMASVGPTEGSPDQGSGGWQGRPISVELPRAEDVKDLLQAVTALTGEKVVGQAVLIVLRDWVKARSSAQDMNEQEEAQA